MSSYVPYQLFWPHFVSPHIITNISYDLISSYLVPQVLAPPLNDNLQFHAFFMYHHSDREWVLNVIEKLESPALGFRCCCYERDLNSNLSQPQGVLYGMKHSLKTVIILSAEFVTKMWPTCDAVMGEIDIITLQKDFVLVLLSECEVPDCLSMANFVRANKQGWWTRFLARLALPGETLPLFFALFYMHKYVHMFCFFYISLVCIDWLIGYSF